MALEALFPELEVGEPLGSGGMGSVFVARQRSLDRLVAVKVMRSEGAEPSRRERFEREARALARLNHPHIVALYDVGERAGWFYLVMEFVEGEDLGRKLRAGRLEPRLAVKVALEICSALIHAHEAGVVHRDIKPANVLIGADGRAKLADFGLAKHLKAAALELTAGGTMLGTPHYMAPEQRRDPWAVDARADIYALGVVLYEMLTGRLPEGRYAPPSKAAGTSPVLDETLRQAMALKPGARFQTVKELQEALTEAQAGGGRQFERGGRMRAAAAAMVGAAWVLALSWAGSGMVNATLDEEIRVRAREKAASRVQSGDDDEVKSGSLEKPQLEGRTKVHAAVEQGDVEELSKVLEALPDLEEADADGWTPLLLAVSLDRPDLLDVLTDAGAKRDARLLSGATALHVAAAFGAERAAAWLMARKADLKAVDELGWRPLDWAVGALQPGMVRWLLAQGATFARGNDLPSAKIQMGPLNLAAAAGFRKDKVSKQRPGWRIAWREQDDVSSRCAEMVRLLLEMGMSVKEMDAMGMTPLHCAAHGNEVAAAVLLLDRGADPNFFFQPASLTALGFAAGTNATDVMRVLLARGAFVQPIPGANPPLHQAAQYGSLEAAKLLLDYKAAVNERDAQHATALHLAAENGHVASMRLLLERGAEVNARGASGATPLHLAARRNRLEAVRLLCENGANIEARMSGGATALVLARESGHYGVARFLEAVAARNDNGNEK